MANSLISMIKGDSTLINNTEVLDGQVLFNTDEKTILLDDDNTRTKYCGADKSNKNLAPIENGNTATRGYAAGSYVVWKEQLYKVLTQINSGTAFVVGTNIALDTVGAELTQINSDLADVRAELIDNGSIGTVNLPAGTTVDIATIQLPTADSPHIGFISVQFNIANLQNNIYLGIHQGTNHRDNYLFIPNNLPLAPTVSIILPISIGTQSTPPVILKAWSEAASAVDCVWEYIA